MKLTTKITTITLGLTLGLSFVSCKDAEKTTNDAASDAKKTVETATKDMKAKAEAAAADAKDKMDKAAAEAKDKMEKAAAEAKEKAKAAAAAAAEMPKTPDAIIGMFNKMNTSLEGVTDLESAKKAIPALESAGSMVRKGVEAIGGQQKMEEALTAKPELMSKFGQAMVTLTGHMDRIKAASPEAYEFIDEKMKAIMK